MKAAKAAERASKVGNKETKKAETEAAKAAKIKAKEDAKAAKEASRQPEQNGVRRPRAEGVCGRVWGLCDDISTKLMTPAPVANVIEAGTAEKIDMSTLRTQYARWKKFHGISGSIKAVTAQV